jgi:GNAT superfamily N-acetyltransferase
MEAARVAGQDDLTRLAELVSLAVREAASRRGGPDLVRPWLDTATDELVRSLAGYLAGEDRRLWAGTIDGAVVGVAAAEAAPGPAGRIPLLFVEPGARGVGVGEAMLDAVATWLGERGCTAVDISALPGDRDTKQFLEGAGMVARLLVMSRSL